MAQKVAARKMKSRQQRPNCDSDGKADNKRQAFTTRVVIKFRRATWDPPWQAGPLSTHTMPFESQRLNKKERPARGFITKIV